LSNKEDKAIKKDLDKLKSAIEKRFPKEFSKSLAEILYPLAENKIISYDKIQLEKEKKDELLFLAYDERLLLPFTPRTLAWNSRPLTLRAEERYEMPPAIQYLIRHAEKTGEWNPEHAVRSYLEAIGESNVEILLTFFQEMKRQVRSSKTLSKTKKITPVFLKRCLRNIHAKQLVIKLELGKTIAKLKGGGIISPFLLKIPEKGPCYEINPSLFFDC
jgi:hypothetical protein